MEKNPSGREAARGTITAIYNHELLDGEKPLHSLAGKHFASVDDALRVHRFHMEPEELAAVFAHLAHLSQDLAVLAIEEPDVVVGEIGNVQQPLFLVRREHHAAGGTAHGGPFGHLEFL